MDEAASEQRIDSARERLQRSRQEIFALARALKGASAAAAPADTFPRSRLMRALLSRQGRVLLGGAALAATVIRPKLLWRFTGFAPLLRPLLTRYLLPKLLQ